MEGEEKISARNRAVCFFIGHRDAPEELRTRLEEAVERHISQFGVKEYVVGFYPSGMECVPKPCAIARANEYMIQNCHYLICYSRGYVGNIRKLVNMALKRERQGMIKIENLKLSDKNGMGRR